jgi:hypothetical protein
MLLAETVVNVTSVELGGWIACAAFVVVIIRNVMGIKADQVRMKQGTEDKPVHLASPIRMELEKEFADRAATETAIKELKAKDNSLELHIQKQLSELKLAGEKRATDIKDAISAKIDQVMQQAFSRMNATDIEVATIKQQQKSHDDELRAWRT